MHTEFKPEDPEVLREMGYDRRDLNVPLLKKYVFWITFGCILCYVLAVPAYNMVSTDGSLFDKIRGANRRPAQASKNHIQTPQNPLLQDNFTTKFDIKELRRKEDERLGSYGWEDQNAGTVHIPIDKAMERVVSQGVSTGQTVVAESKGNTIPQNAIGPGTSQQR